ncbi:MAG: GNAT family N-acetyltransferase [Cyanobacteria bacterium P01_G01_bin.39]
MNQKFTIRLANINDLPTLEDIRQKAFRPVFASFRNILGDEIYSLAQEPEDNKQDELLSSMLAPDSVWQLFVLELSPGVIGFVSVQLDNETKIGEIGLNAVHPDYSGKGFGTEMYKYAIEIMKESGMQVATVATGGDKSHIPARRAYEKSGFDVQIPSVWMCQKL